MKNKNTHLISVIMNCKNGEKFLHKSIQSVLDQSYEKWELIFWDNKSIDKSRDIILSFKDKRIKYFKAKKLTTLYYARNLAIKKAKGKFITFLDVDDWWCKNKLETQIYFFKKNPNTDVLYSNIFIFNQKNNTYEVLSKNILQSGKITQNLIDDSRMSILSVILKREIFKKIKFDKRYTIIGDLDFFVRLSLIKRIGALQQSLAYYRVHDTNLTSKKINLHIKELKNWSKEQEKKKTLSLYNFSRVYKLINILKVKSKITRGKKLIILKEIFMKPFYTLRFLFLLFKFRYEK
jgi:glycosyltransferase involved in cell wall biosynthesis